MTLTIVGHYAVVMSMSSRECGSDTVSIVAVVAGGGVTAPLGCTGFNLVACGCGGSSARNMRWPWPPRSGGGLAPDEENAGDAGTEQP
ncbi:MAG: hypothetical protein AAEJ43_03540, partial [Gammaproteobacteria bacterium]